MTSKIILCEFGERRKKISFISEEGKSDVQCLEQTLIKESQNDADLKARMTNAVITFQAYDADFDSMVDLDGSAEILSKSKVKVLFNPMTDNSIMLNLPVLDMPVVFDNGAASSSKEPKLYCSPNEPGLSAEADDFIDLDATDRVSPEHRPPSPPNSALKEADKCKASTSHADKKQQQKLGKCTVSDPAPLPPLSEYLKGVIGGGKLLQNLSPFMVACATHLCSLTSGRPTAWDYQVYLRSVCTAYPVLKDPNGSNYYDSFKKQLSACIRNRRCYSKNLGKRKAGAASKVLEENATGNIQPLNEMNDNTAAEKDMSDDTEKLTVELKKTKPSVNNIGHMKLLVAKTLEHRKACIKDSLTGCAVIVSEYPHLKNPELLIHEFELMGYGSSRTNVESNMDSLIKSLATHFKKPGDSDADKLKLLQLAESALSLKKFKAANKAVTVLKVYESTSSLATQEKEAPRAVIYLDGDSLGEVYVVADKSVKVKFENVSLTLMFVYLMGLYYICDIDFPPAYKNFLQLIDICVMGVPSPHGMSVTLSNFLKKLKITDQLAVESNL